MSEIAAAEAIALIAADDARVAAEIARLDRAAARHHDDLRGLQQAIASARAALAAALLPAWDDDRLAVLADRLGLGELAPAAARERLAGERRELERGLAEIEARPEFADHEAGLAEARARAAALDEPLIALQTTLDGLRSEPFFEELCDVEYDAPHYPIPWWTFTYYRHRRRADRIVARHGPAHGATTFAGLRRRDLEIREALAALAGEREGWTTRAATIEHLIAGHRAARASLEGLEERALARLRGRAVDHLLGSPGGLDPAAAEALFAGEPAVLQALRRARGTLAQRELLERLHHAWIAGPRQALVRRRGEHEREIHELGRSPAAGRRIDRARVEARSVDRRPAWDRRHAALEAARRAILDFADFADFAASDPAAGSPWSIMVGDAIDPPGEGDGEGVVRAGDDDRSA